VRDGYARRRGLRKNDALIKMLGMEGLYRDACMRPPVEDSMLYGGGTA
jgi:hypothetical protein